MKLSTIIGSIVTLAIACAISYTASANRFGNMIIEKSELASEISACEAANNRPGEPGGSVWKIVVTDGVARLECAKVVPWVPHHH